MSTAADTLLDSVTGSPKNLVMFTLMIGMLAYSIIVLLMGLIVFFILRLLRFPVWMVFCAAFVLFLSVWLSGVDPITIHLQNRAFLTNLLHGSTDPYFWLCAFPYSLIFGVVMIVISKFVPNIRMDVKRLSKGKIKTPERTVSVKRLQKKLENIAGAAYPTGTILGVNQCTGQYAFLDDRDANLHTFVVGTTGSGKTTAIANIVESVVQRGFPLFYVDGKGDAQLAEGIKRFCEQHSVPFYLFSMTGVSLKYNPLKLGGFTSKKDRIIELRHWSEEHYRKLAEGYLQTVLKILDKKGIPADLFTLSNYLKPEALYPLIRALKDDSLYHAAQMLEKTEKDIAGLVAEIENITNSEIGHLFDCSNGQVITLDKILAENAVVYFCLQPLAFPAYAETLGKLIINDLKALAALQLSKPDKKKLFTFFDEFSIFAGDQIINLINQGRGAGIHAILATQSLSDILQRGGEALLGQVLNNTNNYIIQRQNNPQDAEILAGVIGTKDALQITSQIETEGKNSNTGSIRQIKEFIIHPDEIKRLKLGEGILVNKQQFNVQKIKLRKGAI